MNLEILSSNFQEIYTYVNSDDEETPELVPNFSGTQVYEASRGWGRLWKWFYMIIDEIFGMNYKEELLHDVLIKTHQIFYEQLEEIKEQAEKYQDNLKKQISGELIDKDTYCEAKRKITDWNQGTEAFFNLVHGKCNGKLKLLFERCVPEVEEAPFSNMKADWTLSKNLQALINLEGHLIEPPPFSLLERLAQEEKLEKLEEQSLSEWISRCNDDKDEISIHSFHRGLIAFVLLLPEKDKKRFTLFQNLEYALFKRGLEIFKNDDPDHLLWREELQPGEVLRCNGKEYVLGERIEGEKEHADDKTIYFSLQKEPDKVVMIGNNESRLLLRKKIYENSGWGIRTAKLHDFHPTGKFAIVEKLYHPLNEHNWSSTPEKRNPEDQQLIASICSSIRWMLSEGHSPRSLTLKHLMFSHSGELRSTKVCLPQRLDYPLIEDFFLDCSKGNRLIFKALMQQSGMDSQPHRSCFQDIVKNALKGEPNAPKDILTMHSISHPGAEGRAEFLSKNVRTIQKNCLDYLKNEHEIQNNPLFLQCINKLIIDHYQRNLTVSSLSPDAEDEVKLELKRFLKKFEPTPVVK